MPLAEPGGREMRDHLSVLWRRKATIALVTVLVVVTAVALSLLQPTVYEARARILLRSPQSLFSPENLGGVDPVVVQTQVQVLKSDLVSKAAGEKLGAAPDVSVTPVGDTSVIEIAARNGDPRRAAEAANTYANAYIELRRKQADSDLAGSVQDLQSRVASLQKEIDQLSLQLAALPACAGPNQDPVCSRRASVQQDRDSLLAQQVPLRQRLDQLQVDAGLRDPGVELIAPAVAPKSPIQPTPIRNGVIALVLGLVFGTALVLVLEHFDDSVKDKESLERSARGLPVLGVIPALTSWRNDAESPLVSRAEPSSPSAEAYRTLRTSIQFAGIGRPLRTLQVTSPNASEGKTTTVANLAVVLARAGQRVAVVSCDLRRPRVHEFFGLANAVGLTSVLLGEVPLSSALQSAEGEERLWLLASGPLPPNPSELLSSGRMVEVLAALSAEHDMVLIDSPPVLPVTDAAVLASRTDGTLLVVLSGGATGNDVARAVELLRQVESPVIGTVLNGIPTEGAPTYRYYDRSSRQGKGRGRRAGRRPDARSARPSSPSRSG